MRRLRLLVYEGKADWIKPNDNQAVRVGSPLRCGPGSIHSMELRLSSELAPNDLLLEGMRYLELLADEVVKAETKEETE